MLKWVALCCLLYNCFRWIISFIIITKRKRTDKRQLERQQKPDICSKTSRQQSRRSAPVHHTLSSKPPPSLSHLHPSRLAPPHLPLQDRDVFLTYISSMPLTFTLSFVSSSLPLFYFCRRLSHLKTNPPQSFSFSLIVFILFSSSLPLCTYWSFLSYTQVYIIIPPFIKLLTTQPVLNAGIQECSDFVEWHEHHNSQHSLSYFNIELEMIFVYHYLLLWWEILLNSWQKIL